MGHSISALVCKPSNEIDRAAEFDLPVIPSGEFVIIPLDASHNDDWQEKLELPMVGGDSVLILDTAFTHHVANILADSNYAIIETDYFGGIGSQTAAVYSKNSRTPLFSAPREDGYAINTALKLIGVKRMLGDEFQTLGLNQHRSFEDYFESYYE